VKWIVRTRIQWSRRGIGRGKLRSGQAVPKGRIV
jgi:hypothetical protein